MRVVLIRNSRVHRVYETNLKDYTMINNFVINNRSEKYQDTWEELLCYGGITIIIFVRYDVVDVHLACVKKKKTPSLSFFRTIKFRLSAFGGEEQQRLV